ncbi:ribonuclease T [Altericroceibacterium spongiae]|uniref:Ribonuclease T n=1 Tax=Altericroceibacterium spongiae TaxID=2320269 RepID=A0A420ENN9_9SPHN|nr:ribonuclease T [Altericroceibacterium spongiae]RKF22327.1 ribonuclease T [Altericroceibacterium spongiae]
MIRTATATLLVFLALTGTEQAEAQAYQCRIPDAPVTIPDVQQEGPSRPKRVNGYTLALSWSPEFCQAHEDDDRYWRQCSGQAGRFGFIVHGLWPESDKGFPQYCATRPKLDRKEAARNLCMTPSTRLLAHEWLKHGTCMSRSPETYFKITRILWNSLRWPDFDRLSRTDSLTAGEIRQIFADANPYWEPSHIGLVIDRKGWLEEMRLCYGMNFMPRKCSVRRYGAPDSTKVKIWRGL